MEGLVFEDIQRAMEARDPSLVDMVISLSTKPDTFPDDIPDGAFTVTQFRNESRGWSFRWKSEEEKMAYRVESWKKLESEDAPVPLPDRYQLYEVLEALYAAEGAFARETLLELIRRAPLRLGLWRGMKSLYKRSEKNGDVELFGALLARFDTELSNTWGDYGEITKRTLLYLSRRGWRVLKRLGETFPAGYVTAASAVLREYTDRLNWGQAWVVNHIIYHEKDYYGGRPIYGQNKFRFYSPPENMVEDRAFAELWRQSPRPLFGLLERARSERIRLFAIEGLKADFRAELRDLDVSDVIRLINVDSATVHDFAVWLLENAPRFEQAAFQKLGLHDAVLSLFDSSSHSAREYAAKYARTHARDLPLHTLIRLANHDDQTVRDLVFDLLAERDPRKDVGLDAWGELLGTNYGHNKAVEMLREHFGSRELTTEWFRPRLLSSQWNVTQFAIARFDEIHTAKSVGIDYFLDLIHTTNVGSSTAEFALNNLEKLGVSELSVENIRVLLLRQNASGRVRKWLREDKIDPKKLGVDYWRALAFRPTWEKSDWVGKLRTNGPEWASDYQWNGTYLSGEAHLILGDLRNFSQRAVGFDWLLELVESNDEEARLWAFSYIVDSFTPAHFAKDFESGCELIWDLAVGPEALDGPKAELAREYIRSHHDAIGEEKTGKSVDEETQIPREFLSFERLSALFTDDRKVARSFAIELARYEMARWSPSLDVIVKFCETRRSDVRELFADALLADDTKENKRLRIAPDQMEVGAVYRFCESLDHGTRSIGMSLIDKYPQFAEPEPLFRLTDSPDRRVRAFVIRTIWSLYRKRAISTGWEPAKLEDRDAGPGPTPRPDEPPATPKALQEFLRRVLFGIPPARLPKDVERTDADPRPVPARRVKLYLLETMRDLALEDEAFAEVVVPLLSEFVRTLGKSERGACLVALARIDDQWPSRQALRGLAQAEVRR